MDGEDITELSVTERAKRGISYAFQQPVRFKGITVRDLINIAAGKTLKVSDACAYLSEVGMCARDYIDREVNASLSGGELKRIEIATILARGTKLSVFDEPEAGIDLWSFGNLIKVFDSRIDRLHPHHNFASGTNLEYRGQNRGDCQRSGAKSRCKAGRFTQTFGRGFLPCLDE